MGGDAYKSTADPSHVPELLGLLVSFMILALTFGSLLAAGMPITTSLIGVAVTLSAVVVTSNVVTVSSTAPTLAEMLGLAVGIDYALFILSRHRRQMAEGVPAPESMARALATAGSAVVFAGATVIIALAGLSVAQIPVLTVMGLGAAAAVAVAVMIALTLLPAIALLLGERLRPRAKRAASSAYAGQGGAPGDCAPLGPGRHALPDRDGPCRHRCPRSRCHPRTGRAPGDPGQQHRAAGVAAAGDLRQDHRRVQ